MTKNIPRYNLSEVVVVFQASEDINYPFIFSSTQELGGDSTEIEVWGPCNFCVVVVRSSVEHLLDELPKGRKKECFCGWVLLSDYLKLSIKAEAHYEDRVCCRSISVLGGAMFANDAILLSSAIENNI